MAGVVIIFDFDKTIIDCDSDNWVIDDLGATKTFDELLKTMPWNTAIDLMMKELHSQGKSIEDISNSLKSAPIYANNISTIKSAYALGCELKILSDANLFFIETILKHHELMGYFSKIITNPGFVDEEGKLRISPYHDFNISSHGCNLCPPNMCKGIIMEKIRASYLSKGKKKFIYLGDGKGDYCPCLKLSEEDYVMPRKNFPLYDLICADTKALRAEVHEWSNAEDQEKVLLKLIQKLRSIDHEEETNQVFSMDCKFHIIPVSGHEILPQALPVPH
ncbi:uncharacterized protein A4U43_C01F20530 [Asparagus officinalis]|uniref:Uncharacterized protein n=1 Tax=Asparagus officinalis TaxID=4686 RepID=A0A5P1FR37_ASPOF|nr:inorganic pyrophosphatase 1-like [Asparagus officinalis]ONK80678.1 uncharacterized protein A4U43_C01F20530 [Asparagus officinalis]